MATLWKPHKYQKLVLDSKKKVIAYVGGLQSGKTVAGVMWLLEGILAHPTDDFAVGAPSYKVLGQGPLAKFFSMINVKDWGRYNKQEGILYLKTGGKVYFRSLDDPDLFESMTLRRCWLDEADKMKHRAYINSIGRVSAHQGQVLMTTTPYQLGWLYREIYKPFKEKKKGFIDYIDVIECRSIDNPYFPKESFEQAKMLLSTAEFERRYMGQFRRMTGLVYEDILDSDGEFKNGVVFDKEPEICYTIGGIDWGYADPTAIYVIGVTEDKHLYVLDEVYKTGLTINEIVTICQELRFRHKISMFYADPSQPSSIEELNRKGVPTEKGNREIPYGISVLRSFIRLDRFHLSRNNVPNLSDELTKYHYEEDKTSDIPADELNHACDAVRYIVSTHPGITHIIQNIQNDESGDTEVKQFWKNVHEDIERQKSAYTDEEFNIYQQSLMD